jgi:hypothetical protein
VQVLEQWLQQPSNLNKEPLFLSLYIA